MASEEVHELVVSMKPDGIDETESSLEGASEKFDETASSVDDSADQMEGFAQSFDGAMTAIMAGLAVAATGLMAQVPVLGELMGGLAAVIESIAFQMDGVLRPVLSPITNLLFELSSAIFQADGAWGTLVGVLATVGSVLAVVIPAIAAVGAKLGVFASTSSGVISILGSLWGAFTTIVTVIGSLIAGVISLPVVIGAAIVAALVFIYLFRDEIVAAIGTTIDWFASLTKDAADWTTKMGKKVLKQSKKFGSDMVSWASNLVSDVIDWFATLAEDPVEHVKTMSSDIGDVFGNLVTNAYQWGLDIIQRFINGIDNKISDVKSKPSDVSDAVKDEISFDIRANDRMAERWGSDLVEHFSVGMETGSRAEMPGQSDILDGGGSGSTPQFGASGPQQVAVMLDGRRLDKGMKKHSDDGTDLRGRFG